MNDIILVSGLPRSGTSMMMQILEAGGISILTDYQRTPDPSNPRGYYEFERVKKLKAGDVDWVNDARGKAVKVISDLLELLPAGQTYRVIFMERQIEEVLASQRAMLIRRGENAQGVSDEQMARLYSRHLARVKEWLSQQPNVQLLCVSYNEILRDPQTHLDSINRFLGGSLNVERMMGVIDAALYRQKNG